MEKQNQFTSFPLDMSSQKSTDIALELFLNDLDPINEFLRTPSDQTTLNPLGVGVGAGADLGVGVGADLGVGVGVGVRQQLQEGQGILPQLGLQQGQNFNGNNFALPPQQQSPQNLQQQQLLLFQQQQLQQQYQQQIQQKTIQGQNNQIGYSGQIQQQIQQQQQIMSPFHLNLNSAQSTIGGFGIVPPQQQVVTTGTTGDSSFAGTTSDLPCFPVEDLWDDDNDHEVVQQNQQLQQNQQIQQQQQQLQNIIKKDLGVKSEGKAKKRRVRSQQQQVQNKLAQQRYRERRKQKFNEMEGTVDQLQGEINTLKHVEQKVTELQNENQNLNNLVQNYESEITRLRNQLREMTVTSRMDLNPHMEIQENPTNSEVDKLRDKLNSSMSSIRNIMDKHQLLSVENVDDLNAFADADVNQEDMEMLGQQLSQYISTSIKLQSNDSYLPPLNHLSSRAPNTAESSCSSFKVYVPVPFLQQPDHHKK